MSINVCFIQFFISSILYFSRQNINNKKYMDKVIPILPCPDIKTQVEFYQQLGFEVTGLYPSPSPYATILLGSIELHFWGSRKNIPTENPSMCYIQVEEVDALYDSCFKFRYHNPRNLASRRFFKLFWVSK